jgi:hypothetical protein
LTEHKQIPLFPSPEPDHAESMRWVRGVLADADHRRYSFDGLSDYYRSPEWRCKRLAKLTEAGNKCRRCDATSGLQVHHLTYARLYHEHMDDLEVLCAECHDGADRDREYENGLSTYVSKKYGDHYDADNFIEEFNEWLEEQE